MAEWNRLRSPLEDSFEELCCQLVADSLRSDDGRFIRKGKPDSGVECIFQLPNGDELGWQAKWFRTSPTPGQWAQIDESFKTALRAHRQLTRYAVCLPLDLPDSRRPGTTTAMQKWEEHVAKWSKLAADGGRAIDFELWGDSRLTELLAKRSARGLAWYWFDQTVMTQDWLEKQRTQAIRSAGSRYLPDLNVNTEAKKSFSGFRRTSQYWATASDCLCEVRNLRPRTCKSKDEAVRNASELLDTNYSNLLSSFELFAAAGTTSESWAQHTESDRDSWLQQVDAVYDSMHDTRDAYYTLRDAEIEKMERKPNRLDRKPYDDELYSLQKLGGAISEYHDFLSSAEHLAADANAVLLVGEAGSGKTHLLCDLLEEDHASGRLSLLFHGEQFCEGDPWTQMIRLVGLACDREEFLGAMQSAAQASGGIAIIYINAINEGPGSRIWRLHLAAMEEEIRCWDWLRLCVSVRDQFRSQVYAFQCETNSVHR